MYAVVTFVIPIMGDRLSYFKYYFEYFNVESFD